MPAIEIVPRGPFSLDAAHEFAGGFPAGIGGGGVGEGSITLALPIEGKEASAAIELWQDGDGIAAAAWPTACRAATSWGRPCAATGGAESEQSPGA